MDIKAGINAAVIMAVIGLVVSMLLGIRSLRSGRKLLYFRLRQQRVSYGWRMIGLSIGLAGFAYFLGRFGEPMVYAFFEPSPTPSLTPTITLSPTITLTPTITLSPTITNTPSESNTPTITPTPFIPLEVGKNFSSVVTPNPAAVFSPLTFARDIDLKTYTPIDEGTVFVNPIQRVVAIFSFDGMSSGVQWTVLWYHEGELLHFETAPWEDTTGGYGYVELANPVPGWQPGNYEVQIFVGEEWKSVGRFIVEGLPPTSTPTRVPTATIGPTRTRAPLPTPTLTRTRPPTLSPTPSRTPPPTSTMAPTRTLRPTDTAWPSQTPTP